jgi:outer membrane protein OmpA-like peptidoglycan-associated protein
MRAFALLALCLPSVALADAPTDKYEGSIGDVQIDGVVELPLQAGVYGDELPYVFVNFGEEDDGAWLFRITLGEPHFAVSSTVADEFGSGVQTMNKDFFGSLGKKKDEAAYKLGGKHKVTFLDELYLGEGLVLSDIDAAVYSIGSAPLVLGSVAVDTVHGSINPHTLGLPTAILPSEGVVRFAPADQGQAILDMVGGTVVPYQYVESEVVKTYKGKEIHPNYAAVVEVELGGQNFLIDLHTGGFGSRVNHGVDLGDAATIPVADFDLRYATPKVGQQELASGWIQQRNIDVAEHPGGVVGYLGYDFLANFDIAIDPGSMQIALRPADVQKRAWPIQAFIDATIADLEPEAPAEGEEPEEKTEEDLKAEQETRAGGLQDLGFLYLYNGQIDEGIAAFEEATGLDAEPCEYWSNLGNAYTMAHRFDDAAVAMQKSFDRYSAWASLSAEEREEIEELEDEEREASGVQPQDLDACFHTPGALAYSKLLAGEYEQVATMFDEHADLHPNFGVVAGVAALLAGDDDAAQGPLRQALNMGARNASEHQGVLNATRIALAELYQRSGDFDSAIAHWEREQKWLVGDPFAVQQYATLVGERDGADAVVPALQALAATFPENPVPHTVLANELAAAGKADEAKAAYDAAAALLDDYLARRPTLAGLYGLKAWHLVQLEDWAGAKEAAQKGLDLNPTEGYAHYAMIKVAEIERKLPMALKHTKLAKSHHMGHYFFATLPKPELKITARSIKITEKALEIPEKVFFQTGSAIIDERSYQLLDAIAAVLTEHPEILEISIEGHTDSDGKDRDNKKLSQARAESVAAYLVEKGIDEARLQAKGWGEEKPIGDNETDEGKAANRRVEFLITKK